jgi:hypothetical protein
MRRESDAERRLERLERAVAAICLRLGIEQEEIDNLQVADVPSYPATAAVSVTQ